MTRSTLPSLLCFNLRREIAPSQETWITTAIQVLEHARANGWQIAHFHRARGDAAMRRHFGLGAIEGLEPLSVEPVFVASDACTPTAAAEWAAATHQPLYLIGLIEPVFVMSGASPPIAIVDAAASFGRRHGDKDIRCVVASDVMGAGADNIFDLQRYRATLRQSQ